MKRMFNIAAALSALVVAASAVAGPLIITKSKGKLAFDPATAQPVTIIVPKSGVEETSSGKLDLFDFSSELQFGKVFAAGAGNYLSQTLSGYDVQWASQTGDEINIAKLAGTTTKPGYMAYFGRVQQEPSDNAIKVTISLMEKYQFTPFDLMSWKYEVKSFELDEAYGPLTHPIFHFKFEADSPYNPDSVKANFARLGVPAGWNQVIAKRFQFTSEKPLFELPSIVPGCSVRYALDVYPYHNGSKVIVYGQLIAAETSPKVIDVVQIMAAVNQRLTRIVND